MASIITVKIKYDDNSTSLTFSYPAADTLPSAGVIRDCEQQTWKIWEANGHSIRGTQIHTTVRPNNG